MKKYNFLLVFLIVCNFTFSQNYKGNLSEINTNGLHKIRLPDTIRAASNDNFNFLRIKNSQQEDVPYVLIYDTASHFSTFIPTKIISKKVIKDSVTAITIENKKKEKLEAVTLKITNTKIIKSFDVYGSNNGTDWFGLVANKRFSYFNKTNSTVLEKTIRIPINNYTFLRIDFNDTHSLPINILEAGFYKSEIFKQEPILIDKFTTDITTLKEKKVTQIKFGAPKAYKIDFISFDIATDFFLRNAKIITTKTRKVKKQTETYEVIKTIFKLNSKNENTFYIGDLNEKEFIIEIENQDNPALAIQNIQLLQKPVYLIANLKQKEEYFIQLDTLLKKPSYDLGNFISNKTKNIKEATIASFSEIKNEQKTIKKTSFWQSKTFMWICILLGGFFVVYFAVSMLKDIDSKK